MKKGILICFLFVSVQLSFFCVTPVEVLTKAREVNDNFILAGLTLEKTNLEYEKSLIEATNRKMEIAAEIARLTGLTGYENYIKSFYNEVIAAFFSLKSSQKAAEISGINFAITKLEHEKNDGLLKKALLSEPEWKNSRIKLDEALDVYEKAQEDLKNLTTNYKRTAGYETLELDISAPDFTQFLVTEEVWLKKARGYLNAKLNYDSAKYDQDTLFTSASEYAKKIAAYNLKQKELDLKIAQINALNDKRTKEQSLFYEKRQIDNALKKVEMSASDLKDMTDRLKKGLITETQLNQQKVILLTAEKLWVDSQKNYWTTFLDYLIIIGISLDSLFKQ